MTCSQSEVCSDFADERCTTPRCFETEAATKQSQLLAARKDYGECVIKFDKCRDCLAAVAEKLGMNPHGNVHDDRMPWHEDLIEQIDKWLEKGTP